MQMKSTKTKPTTRARGTLGEEFAVARLREDGWEILERNWRCSHWEIDLIAQKQEIVAFIEVKTRSQNAMAAPAATLSRAQRRRIVLAGATYLKERGIYNTGTVQPRFDLFEVVTADTVSPTITRYAHLAAAYDTGDLNVFL